MKGIDMHKIAEKKRGLIKLAEKYGISHKKVITHSQELDVLINKWMEAQQTRGLSIEYIIYHDSNTYKNQSKK
ncbi:aspartyl-phosphate phosphatase Spo0E family protein [Bacillus toyonensis]|uniref:Aspartyl-phosphate phosphatase Spo0E family protein n=1 Tax=Bacillus toyonensis TaxID=155322 RepID=A0A2B5V7X9_9BACI|nr:aspartyl-phosphate phosphatase Spo0E family protein [Bacillus toyonensis]PEK75803.1 hypothetical protein CN594_29760 [Bacillus toyonensis]PFY31209.1 hypothetical protein COL54_32620 [Bacillus toyonensis]PFY41082.1 hypothetical protein COL55_23855 [Bacillus toyonensis]PFY51926.1 hypothetical protein COL52_32300 [Bacillus toyonensis]PFY55110.1 hypothetical protein COL62_34160 [Bacillus toyonensis]